MDHISIATPTLCRLGFAGASIPLSEYQLEDVESLRAGWLFNWSTGVWNNLINDMRYANSIFVKQWKWDNGLVLKDWDAPYAEPHTYTIDPPIDLIKERVAAHPGQLWLVGN